MTTEQLAARRRILVKRNAARKIRETWKRKQANGTATRGRKKAFVVDDMLDLPAEDVLDELPDSLLG